LHDEAERLFVIEGRSVKEITMKLSLVKSTVYKWMTKENWKEKRTQHKDMKTAFHEELYELARRLMRSIMSDLDSGKRIDGGRMLVLRAVLPHIIKIKEYEDMAKEPDPDRADMRKGLTEDVIKTIEREILGLER
jgi:hypothetical protein